MIEQSKSHKSDSCLPHSLIEAINSRRLVIICGAGVSMAPPSCLPSWRGFNQVLLEEIKTDALAALPGLPFEIADSLRAISLDQIDVTTFSDAVVRAFAGDSYFPVLQALDSDCPNMNHESLAELARRGSLRAIISTNFDTLIEHSFRQTATPLVVLVSEDDYVRFNPNNPVTFLHKVHGSVTESTTLVDTVTQKLRGLPLFVIERLELHYQECHVLVIGYSGADLSFDNNYLALSAISSEGPGITWLVPPGSIPIQAVRNIVARAGERGAILEGELPQFFQYLGLPVADLQNNAPDIDRELAQSKVRTRIREWLGQPHTNPLTCATFCIRLLQAMGNDGVARVMRQTLAALPALNTEDVPFGAAGIFRCLALGASQDLEYERAIYWSQRELACYEEMERFFKERNIQPSPQTRQEQAKNRASALINIGGNERRIGKFEDSRAALQKANLLADEANDDELRSLILFNMAALAEEADRNPEQALTIVRAARALAVDAGMAQVIYESDLLQAELLLSLSEYDRALSALERAKSYAEFKQTFLARLQIGVIEAEIAVRRGDTELAKQKLLSLIGEADLHQSSALALLRWKFAFLLGHCPSLRDEVFAQLTQLLESASDEQPRQEGGRSRLPSKGDITQFQQLLANNELPERPLVFSGAKFERPEAPIHLMIAMLEYQQRRQELLPLFLQLCIIQHEFQSPARLLDAAEALCLAAERANDDTYRLKALNYMGIAHDLMGNVSNALRVYQQALSLDARLAGEFQGSLQVNAALAYIKLGNLSEAERLLHTAIEILSQKKDIENATRARRALAELHARGADLDGAIREITAALANCDQIEDPRARPTLELLLTQYKRRRQSQGPSHAASAFELQAALFQPEQAGELLPEDIEQLRLIAHTPQNIANLGLLEYRAGQHGAGRAHVLEAMERYRAADDRLGVSRCLNNLAGFAQEEENWDEAIKLSLQALSLREALGDIDGQVLTLSNLATYYLRAEVLDNAIDAARRCVKLAEHRPVTRPVAIAWIALQMSYAGLGKEVETKAAARQVITLVTQLDLKEFYPLRDETEKLLSSVQNHYDLSPTELSDFHAELLEAQRLGNVGSFDTSLARLDHLAATLTQTVEERASLEGTRGNVLQLAERHVEACIAYQTSVDLFREAGSKERAAQAACQMAASLRKLGREKEAEITLRPLITELPRGPLRAQVLLTLANTITQQVDQGLDVAETDFALAQRLSEAHSLFEEARQLPGLDDEILGLLELNEGLLDAWEGNLKSARPRLQLSRMRLLRCNSRHLAVCELKLQAIDAAAIEGPNHSADQDSLDAK